MALLQVFLLYRNIKWTLSYSVASLSSDKAQHPETGSCEASVIPRFGLGAQINMRKNLLSPLSHHLAVQPKLHGWLPCPLTVICLFVELKFWASKGVLSCYVSSALTPGHLCGLTSVNVSHWQRMGCCRAAREWWQGKKKHKLHKDFPQGREQSCLKLDVWLLAGEKVGWLKAEGMGSTCQKEKKIFLSE